MKNTLILTAVLATIHPAFGVGLAIDLDLTTPGIQNSITDAEEGDIINFALVVTDLTGNIHCSNGIGGDISSQGTMSVTYDSNVAAGSVASYFDTFLPIAEDLSPPGGSLIGEGGIFVDSRGLAPLPGYTNNLGGYGVKDSAPALDSNGHYIGFINVPGGFAAYSTIFTGSMTLTNVAGNTLSLFPSGIFNNPPTDTDSNGDVALPSATPFSFEQDGEFILHNFPHDFDDQCQGMGSSTLAGATITGTMVPEPSSAALLSLSGLALILRRKRI